MHCRPTYSMSRWLLCFFLSGISVSVVLDVVYRGCTDLTVEDTGLDAVKPVVSAVVLQDPALTDTLTVNIAATC